MTQTPGTARPEGTGVHVPPQERLTGQAAPLTDPALATLPSDRVLDVLLERLCVVMAADIAVFLLMNDGLLRVSASRGVSPERFSSAAVPVGSGFAGGIAASVAPAIVNDVSVLGATGMPWAAEHIRALVGVPLVTEGRVVGVAVVGSRGERTFCDEDVELLAAVAERAAWALEHGLLVAANQDAQRTAASATERLRRLQLMSQELLSDLTVGGVVATVVQRGLSLIGAVGGAVWELDDASGVLLLRGMVAYPDEVLQRWERIPLDADAPAAEAARGAQRVVLRSVADRDDRYPTLRGRAAVGDAFVAAPLVVNGRTIGVLGLGFEHPGDLDGEGLAFIDAATTQCAAAMHRALVVEAQQRSLAEARESARRFAALQRLTAGLADARDSGAIVDLVIHEVTHVLGALKVAVCVLDADAGVMRGVRYHGLDDRLMEQFGEFPYVAGWPAADALMQRRPVLLHDRSERDELYPAFVEEGLADAWVCLPLAIGDRDIGALAISLPGEDDLAPDRLEFLGALSDQCAHALDRARLLDRDAEHRRWLELLAEAGRIFSAPLDGRLMSTQLCRLVVGRLADGAGVFLREANGDYTPAATQHVDPAIDGYMRQLSESVPRAIPEFYDGVLAGGKAVVQAEGPAGEIGAYLSPLRMTSRVVLPLIAGGRELGVLVVMTTAGGRAPLSERDADQLEEIAARLALAIDGARLLRLQTEIAHTLQRSLLPSSLPRVPGAEVAVRYLPGTEGVDVGGDFYDVIPLPSGRVGLVVGDVMGRGVRAAAVMGQLRAAVRSYSLEGHGPAALLSRLDLLVGTLEDGLLVTAIYAEWDPQRGLVLCSCAGHLPPLIHRPGEAAGYVEIDPGLPLGVGAQDYAEAEVALPPGSLLLAFTDGLVEGPDLPVDDGMDQLLAAVGDVTGAMEACDAALAALRPPSSTRRYDDDTALLALRAYPEGGSSLAVTDGEDVVTAELAADTSSPARARSIVAATLERWHLEELVDAGTLLVSELVTNGVRHAGTGMRLVIELKAPAHVRICVVDKAPTGELRIRRTDSSAESGRGLFLVEHLSAGWGSLVDDSGKTVWFELRA